MKKVMNIAVLLNINFKVVNLIFKNYHCFTLATDLIEKNVTALPYTWLQGPMQNVTALSKMRKNFKT